MADFSNGVDGGEAALRSELLDVERRINEAREKVHAVRDKTEKKIAALKTESDGLSAQLKDLERKVESESADISTLLSKSPPRPSAPNGNDPSSVDPDAVLAQASATLSSLTPVPNWPTLSNRGGFVPVHLVSTLPFNASDIPSLSKWVYCGSSIRAGHTAGNTFFCPAQSLEKLRMALPTLDTTAAQRVVETALRAAETCVRNDGAATIAAARSNSAHAEELRRRAIAAKAKVDHEAAEAALHRLQEARVARAEEIAALEASHAAAEATLGTALRGHAALGASVRGATVAAAKVEVESLRARLASYTSNATGDAEGVGGDGSEGGTSSLVALEARVAQLKISLSEAEQQASAAAAAAKVALASAEAAEAAVEAAEGDRAVALEEEEAARAAAAAAADATIGAAARRREASTRKSAASVNTRASHSRSDNLHSPHHEGASVDDDDREKDGDAGHPSPTAAAAAAIVARAAQAAGLCAFAQQRKSYTKRRVDGDGDGVCASEVAATILLESVSDLPAPLLAASSPPGLPTAAGSPHSNSIHTARPPAGGGGAGEAKASEVHSITPHALPFGACDAAVLSASLRRSFGMSDCEALANALWLGRLVGAVDAGGPTTSSSSTLNPPPATAMTAASPLSPYMVSSSSHGALNACAPPRSRPSTAPRLTPVEATSLSDELIRLRSGVVEAVASAVTATQSSAPARRGRRASSSRMRARSHSKRDTSQTHSKPSRPLCGCEVEPATVALQRRLEDATAVSERMMKAAAIKNSRLQALQSDRQQQQSRTVDDGVCGAPPVAAENLSSNSPPLSHDESPIPTHLEKRSAPSVAAVDSHATVASGSCDDLHAEGRGRGPDDDPLVASHAHAHSPLSPPSPVSDSPAGPTRPLPLPSASRHHRRHHHKRSTRDYEAAVAEHVADERRLAAAAVFLKDEVRRLSAKIDAAKRVAALLDSGTAAAVVATLSSLVTPKPLPRERRVALLTRLAELTATPPDFKELTWSV